MSFDPKRLKAELRREARELREAHAGDAPASFLAAMRARPEWAAARVAMLYLPFGVEPLPDYFSGKTGLAEQYLHIWDIPVDDLASEPIVLEVEWKGSI